MIDKVVFTSGKTGYDVKGGVPVWKMAGINSALDDSESFYKVI